jgi:hypothetical protein
MHIHPKKPNVHPARSSPSASAHLQRQEDQDKQDKQSSKSVKDTDASFSPLHVMQLQRTIGNQAVTQLMKGKSVQRKAASPEEQDNLDKKNQTGMPDQLKTGVESLSGYDMSDVNVHYNSSQPAQLQALAYAQGSEIHVGPGQEHNLPHEAWHVVQQKQGRVKPTMEMSGGEAINDDAGLESEADKMGEKALEK